MRTAKTVITATAKPTMASKYPVGKLSSFGLGVGVGEAVPVGDGDGLGELEGAGVEVGELEDPGTTTITESAVS